MGFNIGTMYIYVHSVYIELQNIIMYISQGRLLCTLRNRLIGAKPGKSIDISQQTATRTSLRFIKVIGDIIKKIGYFF